MTCCASVCVSIQALIMFFKAKGECIFVIYRHAECEEMVDTSLAAGQKSLQPGRITNCCISCGANVFDPMQCHLSMLSMLHPFYYLTQRAEKSSRVLAKKKGLSSSK